MRWAGEFRTFGAFQHIFKKCPDFRSYLAKIGIRQNFVFPKSVKQLLFQTVELMNWRTLNPYEILAVFFSLICVLLTIKENIWQWLVGLFGVMFYLIVFYQAKLYANMWLQIVFIALQIYGWYEWLHGGADKGELKISRASLALNCSLVVVAISGTAAMAYSFAKFTDNVMPLSDSAATVLSLLAQWMLAKKYLENWLIWILVNVFYIAIFIFQGLIFSAGLYGLFFILAIIGFLEWRKSYRNLQRA